MKGIMTIVDKIYHVPGKLKAGVVTNLAHISCWVSKFGKVMD